MVEQGKQKHGWWRPVTVLAVALIAAFAATGAAALPDPPLPVHAAVADWAQDHPGEPVPLIVQHDGTPEDLLTFVRESGGVVEREFHIIPALDVNVPAGRVADLARQDDVSWVSLDAPVRSTSDPNVAVEVAADATTEAATEFTTSTPLQAADAAAAAAAAADQAAAAAATTSDAAAAAAAAQEAAAAAASAAPGNALALATAYPFAVNAPQAWETHTGDGITVALVDTGVSRDAENDFRAASNNFREAAQNFLSASANFQSGNVAGASEHFRTVALEFREAESLLRNAADTRVEWVTTRTDLLADEDGFGHGTHVGGIIAGYSTRTSPPGKYVGIAPGANVLSVRIGDNQGNASVGDLMAGLQFVDDNRTAYNIRVLNLSVTSSVAQSYKVDPIDAAVELLWFHDVVVVVAAGNLGDAADAVHYPPANDPFVITVGAFDDMGTASLDDDALASWSSRGNTQDGINKPDVLGPGVNIVAPVSGSSYLATNYPQAVVDGQGNAAYFRMSGTSMATGAVSGAVALIRQVHPEWTPGEVKYVLMETARSLSGAGEGVLANEAVGFVGTPQSTNDGITPNLMLLAAGLADAVSAGEVEIGTEGIRWRDADGNWHETSFEGIRWRDLEFEGIRWRGLELNGIRWRDVDWSGIRWRNVTFDGVRWGGIELDGIRWRGIRWRAFVEE